MALPMKKPEFEGKEERTPEGVMLQMIELQGEISQVHNLSPLLGKIVQGAVDIFKPNRAVLGFLKNGNLEPKVTHGVNPAQLQQPPYKRLWDLANEAHQTRSGKLTPLSGGEGGVTPIQNQQCLSSPLMVKNKCYGALVLEGNFSQEDYQLFSLFTNQAAIAVENAKEFERLQTQTPTPITDTGERATPMPGVISTSDLQPGKSLDDIVAQFEAQVINQVIKQHHGNKTLAAKSLGITRGTLYNKLNAVRR